jgi:hypothetical protein
MNDEGQPGKGKANGTGKDGSYEQLSLPTDVKQPGFEGKGDRQTAKNERGGFFQSAAKAVALPNAPS